MFPAGNVFTGTARHLPFTWRVRTWKTVAGTDAATPVRPSVRIGR